MWRGSLLVGSLLASGCSDEAAPTGSGGGSTSSTSSTSSGGAGGSGGSAEPVFRIASPADGSDVLGSANLVVEALGLTPTRVEFARAGDSEPLCVDESPIWSCLFDLSLEADGSEHVLSATGFADNEQIGKDSITLVRVVPEAPICKDGDGNDVPLTECLAALGRGVAAGNAGDFYDNLDGDHTTLDAASHPGITYLHTAYGTQSIGNVPEHEDPADALVGNASLCSQVGAECFGQLRWLLSVGRADTLAELYRENKFFWFPEHMDHDEVDKADYMVPFTNNSQGSSGSEMDEVAKFLYAMAALPPAVKADAIAAGTLMPAVQMMFRRTRVASDTEYLSGLAHANAFDDVPSAHALVRFAGFLQPGMVPPVAELTVVEEDFDAQTGEQTFTTPVSISRKWMGAIDLPRRMVVQAAPDGAGSRAVISYHWRVLRGDPAGVRIQPQNEDSSRVEIEIDHHLEETVEVGGAPRLTKLVVVGLFIHDGLLFSAPSFVTSYAAN